MQGALVAVVVGRVDAFRLALDAGYFLDRAAVLRGYAWSNHAGERAMVALDSHDPGSCDPQIGCAEVTHTDQVGGDERILERHEYVEGGLGVGEHARWVVKAG